MIRRGLAAPSWALKPAPPSAKRNCAMKIGFIGLGRMGGHVAANLLKAGHQRDGVEPFAGAGAGAGGQGRHRGEDRRKTRCRASGLLHAVQRRGDARGRPGRAAAGKSRQGPDPCEPGHHLGGFRARNWRRRTRRRVLAISPRRCSAAPKWRKRRSWCWWPAARRARWKPCSRCSTRSAPAPCRWTTPEKANLFKIAGNFMIASELEAIGEAFALLRKGGVDPAAVP